jgi:hypothetical protein
MCPCEKWAGSGFELDGGRIGNEDDDSGTDRVDDDTADRADWLVVVIEDIERRGNWCEVCLLVAQHSIAEIEFALEALVFVLCRAVLIL